MNNIEKLSASKLCIRYIKAYEGAHGKKIKCSTINNWFRLETPHWIGNWRRKDIEAAIIELEKRGKG